MQNRILLCLTISFIFQASAVDEPSFVIEIFRHGARGAEDTKYDTDQYWGVNQGELTSSGMRMHYLLGNALKSQYKNLLKDYDPEKIYVRSTKVNRTLTSAYSHLYGMFEEKGPGLGEKALADQSIPPFSSPIIQETVKKMDNTYALPKKLQPIPIHSISKKIDTLLRVWDACPAAGKWYTDGMADKESTSIFQNEMKEVVDYLKEKNIQINNLDDLYSFSDLCVANKFQGVPLPGEINPQSDHYRDVSFLSEWYTVKSIELFDDQVILYALDLLTTIQRWIEDKVKGTNKLDFVILSAHDTTLLNLLIPFNITQKDCLLANYRSQKAGKDPVHPQCVFPVFASNLIFELYQTADPYIILKYNNNIVPLCGNQDGKCTVKNFATYVKKLTKGWTMDDFNQQCGISVPEADQSSFWVIVLSIACAILLVAIVLARKELDKLTKENNSQPLEGPAYFLNQ